MSSRPDRRRLRRWALGVPLLLVLVSGLLFVWNGVLCARGTVPSAGVAETARPEAAPLPRAGERLRVLAWNLAKCFVHHGGIAFSSRVEVERRVERMAALIRGERPDLVFLSEVVTECTPCPVDQVAHLARATGLPHWVFGENYNFGLPFLRIVGGNAILSRHPLEAVGNPDLAGRQPFWVTRNNRRVLLARMRTAAGPVLLGAMHTDSFDLGNNLRQTEQILGLGVGVSMLLAGDFNAEPDSPSLDAIAASRRFVGARYGPATFPADAPERRIDYVFAPAGWKLVESRVLEACVSDHRAVLATFEMPR
ncbi:MAG: endonuclease/exonuclease/phosphatase family protein [Planctomycetes bacterium]|nr:endonuclease/exonuclease/phosphatase family protein [Planctomycetota bacterium]